VVQPNIEVADESNEVTAEEEPVASLAETGPHETGLIALVGLELLLAGIAITRLSARRGRARAVRR
jgi:LPXTG-motif cell wall-anchored protein